jgi:hypothetical protein
MSVSWSVVSCQVEVSASGLSLVHRSSTECGVSQCVREASILRRPWPTRGCYAIGKINAAWPFRGQTNSQSAAGCR